jgi:hypothetical protein
VANESTRGFHEIKLVREFSPFSWRKHFLKKQEFLKRLVVPEKAIFSGKGAQIYESIEF